MSWTTFVIGALFVSCFVEHKKRRAAEREAAEARACAIKALAEARACAIKALAGEERALEHERHTLIRFERFVEEVRSRMVVVNLPTAGKQKAVLN